MVKKLTKKEKEARKAKCLEYLNDYLKKGDTVYTYIARVTNNGMTRWVKVFCVVNGQIIDITYNTAHACGYRLNKDRELSVGGCGFNAGFDVVHHLSYALHGYDKNVTPTAGYTLKHGDM